MKYWKIWLTFYVIGGVFSNGAIYTTMQKECDSYKLQCGRVEALAASIFWPTYWSQEAWKSYRSKVQPND